MKTRPMAAAADIPLLDIDRVSMRFGGLVAVSDLDLDVPEGQIIALIGPDGSGKTTVCNCVSGICSPTSGSVRFQGHRLSQTFSPGVLWMAIGVGLLVGLLTAAAAVDVDRLWLAVVKRGMVLDEPFTFDAARRRLRSYFRGELAVDQLAGKWRVVSADGRDVLAIRRDYADAVSLRNQLQAAVTARRAGPSTIPDASDMADAASPSQPQASIEDDVLDRLAAGKSRIRIRGWSGLIAGWMLGAAGTIAIWRRGRRSAHAVARAGIARTFQLPRLFTEMTVLENVLVGLDRSIPGGAVAMLLRTRRNRRGEEEARRRAHDALGFVGLEHEVDRIAGDMPLASRRRLEIARALATGATLMLLDEPTAGLDATEAAAMTDLIRRLKDRGPAVLLTGDRLEPLAAISDRVAVLEHGAKIAEGAPAEIGRHRRVIEIMTGHES
jgi:branched-chain amino acid transport system ATP-binding protein